MASIRQAAQNVLDEARDGIAWIVLWKEGRGWNSETFYPDFDERTQRFNLKDDELDAFNRIVCADRTACFVNSWYHNLGDTETMTRDTLASTLRWQYDLGHARLWSVLQNCA